MGRLAAMPIYIEDTPGLSIMEVRSKARRLQSQAGVDLIIIDYLQLMAGSAPTTACRRSARSRAASRR